QAASKSTSTTELNSITKRLTLVPYTTLFRSSDDPAERAENPRLRAGGDRARGRQVLEEAAVAGRLAGEDGHHLPGEAEDPSVHQDRKSIRLNSSHVKISYDVFCM